MERVIARFSIRTPGPDATALLDATAERLGVDPVVEDERHVMFRGVGTDRVIDELEAVRPDDWDKFVKPPDYR